MSFGVRVREETLRIIEVVWSGPLDLTSVAHCNGPSDFGLIAVYGTHAVFGDDALLFMDGTTGEASESATFGQRLGRIAPWLDTLPSEPTIYLGRLGGIEAVPESTWRDALNDAMRLMIFFHSPPWNGRHIDHHRITQPTVVLNLGRRHRLQQEVSTLWDQSAWTPGASDWVPFSREESVD